MLLLNGGLDAKKHAFIISLFGILILLHGIYVFFRLKSKRREGDYTLSPVPIKFLPFLIWLIFSVNFISPVPWLGQMYLIYFFEAFIVLWIAANHINNLKQIRLIFIGLSIPFLVYLYLAFAQFFHGKSISELGVGKIVSGLFFESNSYTFLTSIVIAGLAPTIFFRYWKNTKRFTLFSIFLLVGCSMVMANNFQGFLMLALAFICSSYFVFNKNASRIKFFLIGLVVVCLAYVFFYFSFTSFGDYFSSAFNLGSVSYLFTVWIASLFLFIKNCLLGVGLGGFEAKLFSVKSFSFPLIVSNPSNFYLLLLSELGIVGTLFLTRPIIALVREKHNHLKTIPKRIIIERSRRVPSERLWLSILLSLALTFALISFFHSVIFIPFFICIFALLIAILNFKMSDNSSKLTRSEVLSSQILVVRKNTKNARYYLGFTCLLSALFVFDGYKVFKAQEYYENASSDFQTILETPANFDDRDLINALSAVEDSINKNKYHLDAWLLKNEILNALYNKNSIRYEIYPELMLEASEFVIDRKKNYWKAWVRHGVSLTLVGDLKEAEYGFNRAIKLAPQNFETNFYMGSFLIHFKDRLGEAKAYIEKALAIAPTHLEALAMGRKLNL